MKYSLEGEKTERLTFVKLNDSYFDEWLAMFAPKTMDTISPFLGLDTSKSSEEICKEWIERALKRYENEEGGMHALIDKKSGKLIGQSGLILRDFLGKEIIDIGYSILPKYWGNGYASEAAEKCLEIVRKRRYCNTIYAIIEQNNVASTKVALKIGMKQVETSVKFKNSLVNLFALKINNQQ